jgi:hypothetical protein
MEENPASGEKPHTHWSARQHLLFLMLWWATIVVYYVALSSTLWRFSKEWITWDMLYGARYFVLGAGLLGAVSAERKRWLWFVISALGLTLFLLFGLLLLGAIRSALAP